MQNTTRSRSLTILGLGLLLAAAGVASGPAPKSTPLRYDFHSVVPLGIDALELQPARTTVYLLASAESSAFEGLQRVEHDGRVAVFGSDGQPVERFPEVIDFRLTASARKRNLVEERDRYPVKTQQGLNDYLLGLKFRLQVYHGLEGRTLEPESVRLIGMPADVPYDERIYRMSFHLGQVPLEDRMVLEVFAADGRRVSKFPLIFY